MDWTRYFSAGAAAAARRRRQPVAEMPVLVEGAGHAGGRHEPVHVHLDRLDPARVGTRVVRVEVVERVWNSIAPVLRNWVSNRERVLLGERDGLLDRLRLARSLEVIRS